MSRTREEQDERPSVEVDERSPDGRAASRWRSAGRAVVGVVYRVMIEQEVVTDRPTPRRFAPDRDAHSDAERIADLLRTPRRSTPVVLGFIAVGMLGTGVAAVVSVWGAPWWAWLTVTVAMALGAAVGVGVIRRSVPSAEDAITQLRTSRFRPPPRVERPSTAGMVAALLVCGAILAPMSGVLHGTVQADLWAFDNGVIAAGGLTMLLLGRRTAKALAVLPEAHADVGGARTVEG